MRSQLLGALGLALCMVVAAAGAFSMMIGSMATGPREPAGLVVPWLMVGGAAAGFTALAVWMNRSWRRQRQAQTDALADEGT